MSTHSSSKWYIACRDISGLLALDFIASCRIVSSHLNTGTSGIERSTKHRLLKTTCYFIQSNIVYCAAKNCAPKSCVAQQTNTTIHVLYTSSRTAVCGPVWSVTLYKVTPQHYHNTITPLCVISSNNHTSCCTIVHSSCMVTCAFANSMTRTMFRSCVT